MAKRVEPVASPWTVATKAELADRLGVGRNTPAAWQGDGAPAALCELQWRMWAAAEQRQVKDPTDRALLEKLAAAGIPHYRQLLGGAAPTAQGQLTLGPEASIQEQERIAGYLDVHERLVAHQERLKQLIPQAMVEAALTTCGQVLNQLLVDLLEDNGQALAERIAAARARVHQQVLAELKKLQAP